MKQHEEKELREFAARLGHRFLDLTLLRDALTHRSLCNERPQIAPSDNERLEFLGDAVVGQLVSSLLFELRPEAKEGELTRRRADLVCEQGLAKLAEQLRLGEVLRLGQGELRTGGRHKPRLLASALEACFAAVYLDGGFEAVERVGRVLLTPALQDQPTPGANDYKSRAQELSQRLGWSPPRYRLEKTEGPEHDRMFYVQVHFDGNVKGAGAGRSKASAEQAAAEQALAALEERLAEVAADAATADDEQGS